MYSACLCLLVNGEMHHKSSPLGAAKLFMPRLNLISLFIIMCTLGLFIYDNGLTVDHKIVQNDHDISYSICFKSYSFKCIYMDPAVTDFIEQNPTTLYSSSCLMNIFPKT